MKHPVSRNFYFRSASFLSLTIAALLFFFLVFLVPDVVRDFQLDMEQDAVAVANTVAASVKRDMVSSSSQGLRAVLFAAAQAPSVEEVQIIDRTGSSVLRAYRTGSVVRIDSTPRPYASSSEIVRTIQRDDADPTWAGSVRVIPAERRFATMRAHVWRDGLIALIVVLGIGMFLLEVQLRPVARTLEQLTEYSRALKRGERLPLKVERGIVEFDQLGDALQQAAAQIGRAHV